MTRISVIAFGCLLAIALCPAPAAACPSCKVAVQQDGTGADGALSANSARGYYWSILAMLTMLSLVAAGLVRLMIRASREVPSTPAACGQTAGAADSEPACSGRVS